MEEKNQNHNDKDSAKILSKAISLLKLLAEQELDRKISVVSLSKQLGISRSTTYRILDTLLSHQFIIKDNQTGGYKLGWEICRLAQHVQSSNYYYDTLHNFVIYLANEIGETINLSIIDGNQGLVIDSYKGAPRKPIMVDVYVGAHEPLHATAYGKALLFDYTYDQLLDLLGNDYFISQASQSNWDINSFFQHIQEAKVKGYSTAVDEFESGIAALACPVRDFSGKIVAAVSVTSPTNRMFPEPAEKWAARLVETAAEMSQALGYKCY